MSEMMRLRVVVSEHMPNDKACFFDRYNNLVGIWSVEKGLFAPEDMKAASVAMGPALYERFKQWCFYNRETEK